jgi:hypothetical protein
MTRPKLLEMALEQIAKSPEHNPIDVIQSVAIKYKLNRLQINILRMQVESERQKTARVTDYCGGWITHEA